MAVESFQNVYARYPGKGYPGAIALPNIPYVVVPGRLYVPTGGRKPRPGDAMYYDATRNEWAIPTDAATLRQVTGILTYQPGVVATDTNTIPAGANSPNVIEHENDAPIWVGRLGAFYVLAGEALEMEDQMAWDVADFKWDKRAAFPAVAVADAAGNSQANINTVKNNLVTAIQNAFNYLAVKPIVCMSEAPVAADGLAIAMIGYGEARL